MDKTRKAVIYIGIKENDYFKLFEEKEKMKHHLELFNINIENIYTDVMIDNNTLNRPGFNEMIKDIKDNKIETIYVKDLSMLIDKPTMLIKFYDQVLKKNKVDLILVNDDIDFKAHISFLKVFKEMERSDRRARKEKLAKYSR